MDEQRIVKVSESTVRDLCLGNPDGYHNHRRNTIIAMALTSQPQRASFPLTYKLEIDGLPRQSWVKISQIRTLAVARIGKRPYMPAGCAAS